MFGGFGVPQPRPMPAPGRKGGGSPSKGGRPRPTQRQDLDISNRPPMNQVPRGGRFDEFAPYDEPMPYKTMEYNLPTGAYTTRPAEFDIQPVIPGPAPSANVADQSLLDQFNTSQAASDFGLSATFDPETNRYVTDIGGFGFTGDQRYKYQTPEEFAAQFDRADQARIGPQPQPGPMGGNVNDQLEALGFEREMRLGRDSIGMPIMIPTGNIVPMTSAADLNRAQQAAAAAEINSPFGAPLQSPVNRGAMMGGVAGMPGGKARGGRTRLY